MTSYTDNRRYPYPSSEREAGNGGAHSEALARAVAADLDVLDAAWALEPTKTTKIANLSADGSGLGTGTDWTLLMNNVVKSIGSWDTNNPAQLQVSAPGWYYVTFNIHTVATGAVTGNARHICYLRQKRNNSAGITSTVDERFGDTYTTSVVDVYNKTAGMFRCLAGDRFWCAFQHTNAASTVKVSASGTYLTGTRLCGL